MMSTLAECFRYHRQHGRTATEAIALARQDVANLKNRYPSSNGGMAGGRAFAAYGKSRMVWFEKPADYMRMVGFADDIAEIGHRGWFTDDDGDRETMRGVVYQLPTRKGKLQFLYGYADPNNEGAACLSLDIADDKKDAARWADRVAESAAEQERDYQRAWRAGRDYDELGDKVAEVRQACLSLIMEAKAACERLADFNTIKLTIRAQVESYVKTIRKAREKREKLKREYGTQDGFVE